MDVKSILKNGATQTIGNIEKAIIEITDEREKELTIEKPVSMGGASLLKGGLSLPNMPRGVAKRCFYVQFNPSELSFGGYGGGQVVKTDYSSKDGKGITFDSAAVRIMLNVQLIFDKVDPQDAFMSDKLTSSMVSMAQGTVKGIRTAAGKKENSVQKEVEGFLAALRSSYTCKIAFYWGTMNYTGVLNKVSSQYTMFNIQGEPIRASVRLSLVCADEEIAPGDMGIWQDYYEAAFGAGSQSYVKAAQKVGNLFALNL